MVRLASLLALLILFAFGGADAAARTGAVLAVEAPVEIVVAAEEVPCEPATPSDRAESAADTRADAAARMQTARSRTEPATPPPER